MKIWKYELRLQDEQTIDVPQGAIPLTMQVQGGSVCLWMEVDPQRAKHGRRVWIHGTGHEILMAAYARKYVGSFQLDGGTFVFHVYVEVGK